MSSETTRTIKYSPVADTLRFINRLQQAATPTDSSILRYNNLILGEASKANTRPFILYLPNGEPFKLATLPDSGLQSASLFRVEDVNENSATIRALAYNSNANSNHSNDARDMSDSDGFRHINTINDDLNVFERQGLTSISVSPTKTLCTVDLNSFIAIQCLEDVYVPLDDNNL